MNDHRPLPDDDALELASAYLDDELDPAGRATVEASSELLDLVAELRWARDLLAHDEIDLPTSNASVDRSREAAVGAALAVYDREIAPTLAASPGRNTVVPLSAARRWQRRTMVITTAAAGLLLVGVIVGSLGGTRSDDDMDMSGGAEMADSRIASPAADEALAGSATAAVVDPAATDTATVVTIDTIIGPASVPTVIDDPAVLLELAGEVLGPEWIRGDASAITPPPADLDLFGCTPTLSPSQLIIAAITYVDQPALAVADLSDASVSAIDLTCNVLASAAYAG